MNFLTFNLNINSKTSSHYSGSLPVEIENKLKKRLIFVTDSSTWKFIPSHSPTFSIISIAYLKTKEILNGISKTKNLL